MCLHLLGVWGFQAERDLPLLAGCVLVFSLLEFMLYRALHYRKDEKYFFLQLLAVNTPSVAINLTYIDRFIVARENGPNLFVEVLILYGLALSVELPLLYFFGRNEPFRRTTAAGLVANGACYSLLALLLFILSIA